MIRLNSMLKVACVVFGFALLIGVPFVIIYEDYFNLVLKEDAKQAADFSTFFGSFIGTLFSVFSVLLLIYTITSQYIETFKRSAKDHFFKMLDYHTENVRNIKVPSLEVDKLNQIEEGRRAFVVYKIQLKRLLQVVSCIDKKFSLELSSDEKIDIAYVCFFFGVTDTWTEFIQGKLSCHKGSAVITAEMLEHIQKNKNLKLGRTNQTELSSYFRNMYNAIKLVDGDKYLSRDEKLDLIKIYRAQLSNPELYILFFNLVSRFGKKWDDKGYIDKYELLTNLPHDYCEEYNPKDFFDISYEEDEVGLWRKAA